MKPPGPSLLELRGVAIPSRDDPANALVNGIDWSVQAGEFWVVAGLPGCGKSQLFEVVAGLTPPRAGAVSLNAPEGGAMGEETQSIADRIGLLFAEGGRPFNHLTVAQNVGLPLCYHRGCPLADVAPQVQRLLEWVGLAAHGDRWPWSLNRGLRQRVALARALARQPSVLLLDNPLSGLAVSQTRWWLDFLAQFQHTAAPDLVAPAAMAVATDDLRPWLGLGTDFALIEEGRWRLLGHREDVAASPDPAIRELLSDPV